MATLYSKQILSGSNGGRAITIAETATPGTLVHKSVAGSTSFDEIWIYAQNVDVVPRKLSIEYGATLSTSEQIVLTIEAQSGLTLVVPGLILNGSLEVRAFGPTGTSIYGYVNRIS